MRIAIDVQTTLGQKTGFGFYVQNLTRELKKLNHNNEYILLRPKEEKDLFAPQRFIWDQFTFPKMAIKEKVDILHQPSFSAPIFYRGKIVVTAHDLIAILYGKDIPYFSRQYFGRWMPFSYQWADKIICDSINTKNDIIKYLKVPSEKLRVIYLAADNDIKKDIILADVSKVKIKYKTGDKYLLHTGTLNPRKNLEFLIRVYSQIVKSYPDYNLVIVGKKGWYYEGLFTLTRQLGLENKVIFAGYIADEDKSALYKGAQLFLFPSHYEGFGLPPLEAMSIGVPVISSNTSSLPEIVENAGILLSPSDELSWVRSIKSILSDRKLHNRYSKLGLIQSQKFSWAKTAAETLMVYKELQ